MYGPIYRADRPKAAHLIPSRIWVLAEIGSSKNAIKKEGIYFFIKALLNDF
jgi:hypothetical protein